MISDFGEARCYEGKQAAITMRHRGTEHYQSPEMLKMRTNPAGDFDRRQTEKGAGFPCDVWSLGCLLFEMITGEVLQFETVFMKFYYRVTGNNIPVIDDAKARLLHKSYRSEIIGLLEFILVRDQNWRPSIGRIIERVDEILSKNVLPAFQSMSTMHPLEENIETVKEKPTLREGLCLRPGITDLTERVSVCLGADVFEILNTTFMQEHGVKSILFTKDEGGDEVKHSGQDDVVLGLCSRMNIEGVFLVDLTNALRDDEMLVRDLGLEKQKGEALDGCNKLGRVVICGHQCSLSLVDFTVMVLNKLERMSNFEALLTIKREGL